MPSAGVPDSSLTRRRYRIEVWVGVLVLAALPFLAPGTVRADPLDRLMERLERLEEESRWLRKEIEVLNGERTKGEERSAKGTAPEPATSPAQLVRFDRKFGSEILDPTTDINRKPRLVLERRKDGTLAPDSVHLHGSVTAVANHQKSNRADKFGYLMRHPTGKNQVGDMVSEAAIHSAQLGDWLTGHAALLFDPEQSFGAGTNTSIERNQVHVRHAYALFGNLGGSVRPHGHRQPLHGVHRVARLRGAREQRYRRVCGREGGRHGDGHPGRGAVPRRERSGRGDGGAEPAQQFRPGRALFVALKRAACRTDPRGGSGAARDW